MLPSNRVIFDISRESWIRTGDILHSKRQEPGDYTLVTEAALDEMLHQLGDCDSNEQIIGIICGDGNEDVRE